MMPLNKIRKPLAILGWVVSAGLTTLAIAPVKAADSLESAIFAGGCFWCMEEAFEKLPGVSEAISGYSNGHDPSPEYKSVSQGVTGHAEVIKVQYDPTKISYKELVDHFWINIDPTVKDRQFCDSGSQYRSGIYYLNDKQKQIALESLQSLKASRRFEKIYTEIEPAEKFFMAESYHQDYYQKNPFRYRYYKNSCGREDRLEEIWGSKG